MPKQKFEISFFEGIDLSVSSEDSNQQSAVKTRNINNLRGMGNLTPIQDDQYFTRDGLSSTVNANIGINKDNWILKLVTLKDGDKTDLVMISAGEGAFYDKYADEGQTGGSIDIFKDIYSENIEDINLAGEDEAIPNDLVIEGESINANNSLDLVVHQKSNFHSSANTAAVQKWNESLHIGLGNTALDLAKWVGKAKGGFSYDNRETDTAIYGETICKNSSLKSPEGGVFSHITTDCYTDPYFLNATPTMDQLSLRVGKFAYCYQLGGQFVYKYDCDGNGDGQLSSFSYITKSTRLGNVQAICYEPNGTHANSSFSDDIGTNDGLILVVDTATSMIGNFGGQIILLRASDLEVVARYNIDYETRSSGRGWDDGMTTRELGLDEYSPGSQNVGHVYKGARGNGIGSILVTSPMDNATGIVDPDELDGFSDVSKKTIWISIWGPHKIDGMNDEQWDGNFNNLQYCSGANLMSMASYRILWSYSFRAGANWPATGSDLAFKNSSPPCHGNGNEDIFDDDWLGSNRCGQFRGNGYYFIPRNALSYSDISDAWVDMICTLASRPMDTFLHGGASSNFGIYHNEEDIDIKNEPYYGFDDNDSYSNQLRPMWLSTNTAMTEGKEETYRYPISSAIVSTHFFRDIRRVNYPSTLEAESVFWLRASGAQSTSFHAHTDYPEGQGLFPHSQMSVKSFSTEDMEINGPDSESPGLPHSADTLNAFFAFQHADNSADGPVDSTDTTQPHRQRNTVRIVPLLQSSPVEWPHDGDRTSDAIQFTNDICSPANTNFPDISRITEDRKYPFNSFFNWATVHRDNEQDETYRRYISFKTKPGKGTIIANVKRVVDNWITAAHELPNSQSSEVDNSAVGESLVPGLDNAKIVPFRTFNSADGGSHLTSDDNSAGDQGRSIHLLTPDDEYYDTAQLIAFSPDYPSIIPAYTAIDEAINPSAEGGTLDVVADNSGNFTSVVMRDEVKATSDTISLSFSEKIIFVPPADDDTPDKSYEYRASYEIDGFQDTTLSNPLNVLDPGHWKTTKINIRFECFNENYELYNLRITGINIWRTELSSLTELTVTDYQLLKSISLKDDLWVKEASDGKYYRTNTFKQDFESQGVSFTAFTGISSLLTNTSLNYQLSTTIGSYHFVANVYVLESKEQVPNGIFRSQPAKFDMFDWSSDFITLPETPNAIQGFKGRLYAFSDSKMYVIDPNTLQVLDIFEGGGCFGPNAVSISDEYGMLFVSKNNIYLHNGSSTRNITGKILESNDRTFLDSNNSFAALWRNNGITWWGETTFQRFLAPKVYFFPKQDCFIIPMGHKRNNNLGLAYMPKHDRWDIWDMNYMQTACLGDREDLIYVSGTSDSSHATEDVELRQFQTSVDGDNLPNVVDGGVWYSQKLTMGQPTIEKIFTKVKLAGNFANNIPTIIVKTSEGTLSGNGIDLIEAETSDTLRVYKLSGFKRKSRWISVRLEDIVIEGHIEALSIIYRPGRIR